MPIYSKMISLWNNLFRRRRVERDLNDELNAYVEEMTDRKIQTGLTPEAARDATLLELGGVERIKDLVRQQRIGLGSLRSASALVVVALIAFVSGVSAAVAVLRWSAAAPVIPQMAETKEPSPSHRPPTLQGRLIDKATGKPVVNAEVGLQAFAPARRFTFTDEEGRFDFRNPPIDGYRLEVGNENWYIRGDGPVPFKSNSVSSDRFIISTPDILVKDHNGQPLEGIRLSFEPPASYRKNPKLLDLLRRTRTFHYSSGTIELPVTNPPAEVKRTAFGISTTDVHGSTPYQ